MDVSIKASGQQSKFDIFDSGLTLLALHSACLALAFTASNSTRISDTFNLVLMIAGFASGAVLAVLAAYYGTINTKALGPQLLGPAAARPDADLTSDASVGEASEAGSKMPVNQTALSLEPSTYAPPASSRQRKADRSLQIVTGAVVVLLLLVGTLLLHAAGRNTTDAAKLSEAAAGREREAIALQERISTERAAATAVLVRRAIENGEPPELAKRRSLPKSTEEVKAEGDAAQAREAARKAGHDASQTSNEQRFWRAWLIIGLTALVLVPIPLAWAAPNPALSTARCFLVLGSLLAFVLGVGSALLPLAAQAVGESFHQATESHSELPGETNRPEPSSGPMQLTLATPVPITVVEPDPSADPGGSGVDTGSPTPHPDLDGIRTDIAELKTDMAAALARPVQVRMDPPEIQIEAPPQTPQPLPPIELTVIGAQGERGTPGTPGPVRDCKWDFQRFWPRTCTWVPAPTHLPAEAPRTSF